MTDKTQKSPDFPKPLLRIPKQVHLLQIAISNRQKDLPLKKVLIKKAVKELFDFLNLSPEELSLYFISEKAICALHAQFFNDPSPTDCISFPLDGSHLGEIFICPKAALLFAKKKKQSPYLETLLYLVHGILHLIGYDDYDPADRKAMRKIEKQCMGHLMKRGISLDPLSR